jgi:hypothetical protein
MGITSGQLVCFMPLSVLSRPVEVVRVRTQRELTQGHMQDRRTFTEENALADFSDHAGELRVVQENDLPDSGVSICLGMLFQ